MYRMYTTALAAGAMLAGLALAAQPTAAAQPRCTARDNVIKRLSTEYAEAPVALGLASNGGVVEVFTSDGGSTWTIIITMPNGVSCMIAAGEYWEGTTPIKNGGGV